MNAFIRSEVVAKVKKVSLVDRIRQTGRLLDVLLDVLVEKYVDFLNAEQTISARAHILRIYTVQTW